MVGNQQARSSARLSSGFRINSAADDAAGLGISEKMRSQIRGLDQASRNGQDGISLIQTAEGAMQTINEMVVRIRELVIQASNDTNAHDGSNLAQSDRIQIQREINQLMDEIDATTERTQFNTRQLIDGSLSNVGSWVGGTSAVPSRLITFAAGSPQTRAQAEAQMAEWMEANHWISMGNAEAVAMVFMSLQNGMEFLFVPGSQMNPAALTDDIITGIFNQAMAFTNLDELAMNINAMGVTDAASALAWLNNAFAAAGALGTGAMEGGDEFAAWLDSAAVRDAFNPASAMFVGTWTEADVLALVPTDAAFMLGNNVMTNAGFTTTEFADFLNANFSTLQTALHGGTMGAMSNGDLFNFIGGMGFDATDIRDAATGALHSDAIVQIRDVISGIWNNNAGLGFVPATIEGGTAMVIGNAVMPVGVRLDSTQMGILAMHLNNMSLDALGMDFAVGMGLAGAAGDPLWQLLSAQNPGSFANEGDLVNFLNANREVWLDIRTGREADRGTYVPSEGTPLWFQVGANMDQGVFLSVENVSVEALDNVPANFGQMLTNGAFSFGALRNDNLADNVGVMRAAGSTINNFVEALDLALAHVTGQRANLGAMQNRLEFTIQNLDISSENLSAAESRIRDADMALEMMRLTQANVLQQAATAMLAQANQAPQSILQLLG